MKIKISNTPLVQRSPRTPYSFGHSHVSVELAKVLNETIKAIDTSTLTRSFNLRSLKFRAIKKMIWLKTLRTGQTDFHEGTCSISKNYFFGGKSLKVHIWDEKKGEVIIHWQLAIVLDTNKVSLHGGPFHGFNNGLLEELGIIKGVPAVPDLPDIVVMGESVPSLTNEKEAKTLFLFAEIRERFRAVEAEYKKCELKGR